MFCGDGDKIEALLPSKVPRLMPRLISRSPPDGHMKLFMVITRGRGRFHWQISARPLYHANAKRRG